MDPDLMMVIGVTLGVMTIPAFLAGYTEGRSPRTAIIILLLAGGLVFAANRLKPGGYTIQEALGTYRTVFAALTQ